MSVALVSAMPIDMCYSEKMIETDVRLRANDISSTIKVVNHTYFKKNNHKITFYSILNNVLKILRNAINTPDRVVLLNVRAEIAIFIKNIEKNDHRHIIENQEFINSLGFVYDELRKLINVLSCGRIYDEYISMFDDYANLLHSWQTRLAIRINDESSEILSKLNSVFLCNE